MEFTDLQISEIVFKERISKRKFCYTFLVEVRGRICFMKVHHGQPPKQEYDPEDYEPNIYICESTAYRRFKEAGLCARGITPDFYGTIENIDPNQWLPHLRRFVRDDYPPTAILLEYIPNMKEMHWSSYNMERMQNFSEGLKAIHKCHVVHEDVHPRNMMIFEDDPARALWIDFDRAQSYGEELNERQRGNLDFERALFDEMAENMKLDAAEGKTVQCQQYYV